MTGAETEVVVMASEVVDLLVTDNALDIRLAVN